MRFVSIETIQKFNAKAFKLDLWSLSDISVLTQIDKKVLVKSDFLIFEIQTYN